MQVNQPRGTRKPVKDPSNGAGGAVQSRTRGSSQPQDAAQPEHKHGPERERGNGQRRDLRAQERGGGKTSQPPIPSRCEKGLELTSSIDQLRVKVNHSYFPIGQHIVRLRRRLKDGAK